MIRSPVSISGDRALSWCYVVAGEDLNLLVPAPCYWRLPHPGSDPSRAEIGILNAEDMELHERAARYAKAHRASVAQVFRSFGTANMTVDTATTAPASPASKMRSRRQHIAPV
jgi:hypothetical protein